MKLGLVVILAVMMMAISSLAIAGEPVINHIVDSFTGNNDYLQTRAYIAVTVDLEKVPVLSILNADWRTKISTPIGDGSFREGILETGLEYRF